MSTTDPVSPKATAPSSNTRFIVLLVVFGLMLGALWYDRKVARPAVEDAYARIAKLNNKINGSSGKAYMTDKEVHDELKRKPIDQFKTGPYLVEVYGWRAGLPLKTHKYYAVYGNGKPLVFLKHYMNELDMKELEDLPLMVADGNAPTTDVSPEQAGIAQSGVEGDKQAKEAAEPAPEKENESKGSEGDSTSASPKANAPEQDSESGSKVEKVGDE